MLNGLQETRVEAKREETMAGVQGRDDGMGDDRHGESEGALGWTDVR